MNPLRACMALGVAALMGASAPLAAEVCDWPGPHQGRLDAFLNAFCYQDWEHDVAVRDTGPFIARNPSSSSDLEYGVHPASRIYYSPNVARWVREGRPEGGLKQPAMLVKEMYPPPAWQHAGLDPGESRTRFPYWTVMVRDVDRVADGWYWMFGTNKSYPDYQPTEACAPADFRCRVISELTYPEAGFGSYCTRCHASALSEQTFATIENFGPQASPLTYLVVPPAASPGEAQIRGFLEDGGTHADVVEAPPPAHPMLSRPLAEADPQFLDTFPPATTVSANDVQRTAFPPETFDHATMPPDPNPRMEFITSDQCIGCHDATVGPQWNPPMLFPDRRTGVPANLSPYGEWRYSMMGLAGRDPVFFAQLESEAALHEPIKGATQNLCLSCHGAMGQRQFHGDRPHARCDIGDIERIDQSSCFMRERMQAYSRELDENSETPLRYAALGRDGISCTVCHHIAAEGLGKPETFTGRFKVGPSTELYGPYRDVKERPMLHALGIKPLHGRHLTSSALCGSCHTIFLPVFDSGVPVGRDGQPVEDQKDQLINPEQTTYLEWLNSVYQDERGRVNHAAARSCQSCHMPQTFQESPLAFTVAAIEDDLYPFTHNRLPDSEIDVRPRSPYGRHMLSGINLFALEMFAQFPLILGIRTVDPMVPDSTQPGLATSIASGIELARKHTASIEIVHVDIDSDYLAIEVKVTNRAGHKFPSGVGFRRAFVNVELRSESDALLWASGRTNELGVIVGGDGKPLKTEFYGPDQQQWEAHHTEIGSADEVQIYQLVERNVDHHITTSFLGLYETVKDNRLVPRGWSPNGPYAQDTRPCLRDPDAPGTGDEKCLLLEDPGYADGGGYDRISYKVPCDPRVARTARVIARIYYQAIPPSYLNERFGTAWGDDTKRLYYLTSHLATEGTGIESWKLLVDETRVALATDAVCPK